MKKSQLTGLVFIWINLWLYSPLQNGLCKALYARDNVVQITMDASQQTRAQNEFRRQLLEFLTDEYRDSLKEYFSHWQDSRQTINRPLLEDLINIAESEIITDGWRQIYSIKLSRAAYDQHVGTQYTVSKDLPVIDIQLAPRVSIPSITSASDDINDILFSVDQYLMSPNQNLKDRIDYLIESLRDYKIEYPTRHLVYREDDIYLGFRAKMGSVINFVFENQRSEKIADRNNGINLKVGFRVSPADIIINTQSDKNETFLIKYRLNVERTFRISKYHHNLFIQAIINHYLQNSTGEIAIFYIADSTFWVTSDNFDMGINRLLNSLRQKGWEIGNEQNHHNLIKLNKVIIEERRLNIGSYYVKAFLETNIYDSGGSLLQTTQTKEVEAIDGTSLENAHSRVDRLLMELL